MTDTLSSLDDLRRALAAAPGADAAARTAAEDRNAQLTKPPGALGRLEELAIWYAGWRGDARPQLRAPQALVFAANHGVTKQGISAFPAEVTAQMVENFRHNGAGINALAGHVGCAMSIHPIQLDRPTADFSEGPAMSETELLEALNIGWQAVDPAADLLITGEMGIGNTTSAAAISHALFGGEAADWAGRGTGLDDAGVALKARVIASAVALNAPKTGFETLRCLGGREVAAMAGAIARARTLRIPVILDGYICSAAAACLAAEVPAALDHAVAGHASAEVAHPALLARLGKAPLLTLGLRLGEGTGAAVAINLLAAALAAHNGMATFAEAGVSEG
ncbi:nicotinate-nucleotide--dimethylbenzimidazole phosphoribosyltransferase [Pseudooceanicola sp. CBS1P-1]|uniref:Nicotinate-nucleotide--dimethylbenzimidazole phosphoribosyltransferase n=1 Tax=Pseudooceanicola albus TaxID=2692189 RepID=A0A6L7G2B5_9RHOB|nr:MULTISPECIES: nicotinate-nucleotide--dimethylbenzimidazole phosphoribosyltransferase [Pseudooceanicola]MBT9383726.1 nicotinate-nucleotide--dimethylbenzimidazole phosphoribosyltransferase [Pseudooceanicola endophyticus]MXN17580.1 nicotinate-nucleotide--dimethylbenzimidazole phosphoribosyltransferase [Pseudooceanicola albus]